MKAFNVVFDVAFVFPKNEKTNAENFISHAFMSGIQEKRWYFHSYCWYPHGWLGDRKIMGS
jgi:hypothetical protein